MPYLITSPIPAENSRLGRVFRRSKSTTTESGWWKEPTRFLPELRLIPVFPPTELSTMARRVVGTWWKEIPLRKLAAAKPARSPTTPPPMAKRNPLRSIFDCARKSQVFDNCSTDLLPSPEGTTRYGIAWRAFLQNSGWVALNFSSTKATPFRPAEIFIWMNSPIFPAKFLPISTG